jgi:hypothetical protein
LDPGFEIRDPGGMGKNQYPGCNIPDPDSYLSRISDPKTATKERGEEKFVDVPFFIAINLTKL